MIFFFLIVQKKEINYKETRKNLHINHWNWETFLSKKSNANIFRTNADRSHCNPDITRTSYIHFYIWLQSEKPRACARTLAHARHQLVARRAKCKIRSRNTCCLFPPRDARDMTYLASLRGLFLHEKLIGAVLIVYTLYAQLLRNDSLSRKL